MRPVVFVLLALLAIGCQDDVSTPFPPGLEPLDDDAGPRDLDGTVVEHLTTFSEKPDIIRVYGRGFIFAPLDTVYTAAHDPQVMIAACSTTTQGVMFGNDPAYELSFLVHYFVDDILDVEWDDQWRGGTIDLGGGSQMIMIEHQKIQGSDFITLSEGTVELFPTDDPAITEVRFVEHLDAVSASEGDVIDGMQSNYDRLLAVAHGNPIPPCFTGPHAR